MRRLAKAIVGRLGGRPGGAAESVATRYFVHIPKTAGMTVHEFLRTCRPGGRGAPELFKGYFLKDVLDDLEAARRCTVFAGHFIGFLDPLLARDTRKATVLRDPVERAISHYRHVRRDSRLPFHDEFRRRTLAEVLDDPGLRGFAMNVQARYLAALADDPAWLDHTMQLRVSPRDDDELLGRARQGLGLVELVGLHDRLPDFLDRLAIAWDLSRPAGIPQKNVAADRDGAEVTDDERAMLRDLNRVDAELYATVEARLGCPG